VATLKGSQGSPESSKKIDGQNPKYTIISSFQILTNSIIKNLFSVQYKLVIYTSVKASLNKTGK
jgi:hypothetical protein